MKISAGFVFRPSSAAALPHEDGCVHTAGPRHRQLHFEVLLAERFSVNMELDEPLFHPSPTHFQHPFIAFRWDGKRDLAALSSKVSVVHLPLSSH